MERGLRGREAWRLLASGETRCDALDSRQIATGVLCIYKPPPRIAIERVHIALLEDGRSDISDTSTRFHYHIVSYTMARTRSTKASTKSGKAETPKPATTSVYSLPEETESPPRFFVIPKKATPDARIVTLQNPRYAKPTRYLICPEAGFFEFNKITTPKSAPRSWLVENTRLEGDSSKELEAQITSDPELYIATPIDPLFLLLPALVSSGGCESEAGTKAPKKRMFLSSDDHFDALATKENHFMEILTWPKARDLLEARMGAACDTVKAGDESMFRLNESKLVDEILSKAKRMSEQGLPKTMDEKFVIKALEAPILGIKSKPAASQGTGTPNGMEGSNSPQTDSADSQSTVSSLQTSASSLSEASTAATSVADEPAAEVVTNAMTASPEVLKLQRLRVAFNFICSSYIAPELAATMKKLVAASSSVDFKPLDGYVAELTKLRQQATMSRSNDYSRKRNRDEEDDERAEKKRKQEEEAKVKKANQSRGVKQLAKVNTSGMKKMSDFFKKK